MYCPFADNAEEITFMFLDMSTNVEPKSLDKNKFPAPAGPITLEPYTLYLPETDIDAVCHFSVVSFVPLA